LRGAYLRSISAATAFSCFVLTPASQISVTMTALSFLRIEVGLSKRVFSDDLVSMHDREDAPGLLRPPELKFEPVANVFRRNCSHASMYPPKRRRSGI
jgi:hypothetical protein